MSLNPLSYFDRLQSIQSDQTSSLTVHKAIINNPPSLFELVEGSSSDQLNQTDAKYGFTTLHVAFICQNFKLAEKICLKYPYLIEKQDKQGWTPFHFGIVASSGELDKILLALKEKSINYQSNKNQLGYTFEQFKEMLQRKPAAPSDIVFHFTKNQTEIKAGTAEEFKQQTEADYTEQLLPTASSLLSMWNPSSYKMDPHLSPLLESIKMQYSAFKARPNDCLYLAPSPESNLGVYASKTILKGSIIWEYQGETYSPQEFQNQPYDEWRIQYAVPLSSYVIDGSHKRNLGAMTNCGFPNAYPYLADFGSEHPHYFLIALEDVSAGNQICFDYGFEHPCKEMGYQELRPEALQNFIKMKSLSLWAKELSARKKIAYEIGLLNDVMQFLLILAKMKYIFWTPKVYYSLLLKMDPTAIKELSDLLSDPEIAQLLEVEQKYIDDIKGTAEQIEKVVLKKDVHFIDFILELFQSHRIGSIDMLIRWFANSSPYEWKKEELQQFCISYNEVQKATLLFYGNSEEDHSKSIASLQEKIDNIPFQFRKFTIDELLKQMNLFKTFALSAKDKEVINLIERVLHEKMKHG